MYSVFFTLLEEIFLRKSIKLYSKLETEGYLKIDSDSKLNISTKRINSISSKKDRIIYGNYQKKYILNEKKLKFLLKLIFEKNFCEFITAQTGFKYSIDFLSVYENFSIPEKNRANPYYANHYHLDKPNSRNMLKIFIPLSKINLDDGPLEIINIRNTQKCLIGKASIDNLEKIYFEGEIGDLFLCRLNLCLHKAGIPKTGRTTKLIMIQLNPSSNWVINSEIYKRQFKIEPKFNSLINIFLRRKVLSLN